MARASSGETIRVDLIVAAMTTDMAIRLAQKAEVEFDLVVRPPKKYPIETHPVCKLLDILGEPTDGIAEPKDSSKKEPSDSFWHTYRGLRYYFDRIMKWDPKKSLPAIVPKDYGDRELHDYTRRALEYAQVGRIGMFGKHPEVWDLVSSGIEHMFHSRQLSIWVIFAVDTLFHSQDILDGRPGGPYLSNWSPM